MQHCNEIDNGVFGARKSSAGSFNNTHTVFAPRVKTSLLGTSARQKLLQYKLAAQHAKDNTDVMEKEQIVDQVAKL